MSPGARVALAALTFCPVAAWALSGVMGCAVNRSGLSLAGGGGASPGAGGSKGGADGTAGAAGGHAGTAGGAAGTAGTAGTVGTTGTAGTVAAAGTFGATGGTDATGSAGTSGGTAATGGTDATGGGGTTGVAGTDGRAGTTGDGGGGQTGGAGGKMHGGGGSSGHADCSSFPMGGSVTLSSDGRLHCYWSHSDELDWNSSESSCVGEGGTLATILSEQENSFVVDLLTQAGLFQAAGVSLGATDGKASADMSGPGMYAWVTGEPWGYAPWHAPQPDGSCTACSIGELDCECDHWLVLTMDGTWYDRPEATVRPFVCEAIAR
jgi:hypothetical protein